MKRQLRLRCFKCPNLLVVDFYDMGKSNRANDALQREGWIFGVDPESPDLVLFDPLCHTCGRETIKRMIERGGGVIDADAKRSLKKIYPDLFEEDPN